MLRMAARILRDSKTLQQSERDYSVSVVGGLYVFAILPPPSPTKRQRWEGTSGTATDYLSC